MEEMTGIGQLLSEWTNSEIAVDELWPPLVIGLILVWLILRWIGWGRKKAFAEEMLAQIRAANLHPVRVHLGPDGKGVVVESTPAPEPFTQLMLIYSPATRIEPLGFLAWLIGRHRQTLRVRGMLRATPATELI